MPTVSIAPDALKVLPSFTAAGSGFGWGYGTSKGQIGVSLLNAPAQALDLAYGVAKVVTLGTVSQDEKGNTALSAPGGLPQSFSDKATDETGSLTYTKASGQKIYTGPPNPATTPQAPHLDGWYAQAEGTGGEGVVQPDNTIRSDNSHLDVPLSFTAADGGPSVPFNFLAALGRLSAPVPAGTTGSVTLYHGYVADPEADYRLDLGTQTVAFANGDKLKVTFNVLALANNPDSAPLTASFVLSGPPPSYAIAATDAVKLEGNSGTTPFTFTVTRTGDTSAAATLGFAVTGSGANPAAASAFAGGTLPSGTVAFAAGATAATVTVGVAGNTLVEPDRGFTVTLSGGPAGTIIATPAASGTILNDDTPPPPTGPTNIGALHGNHGDYVIANTGGQLYIQDTVPGRDGTQTVANPGEMRFADGIGVFDATGNAEAMTRLYQGAFGRAPDAPGLEYAVPLINQGSLTLKQIGEGFLSSGEFQRQYGQPDTGAFVTAMYRNVLHRAINPSDPLDVAGIQNFSNLANAQGRAAALLAISDSQENHRLTLGIAGDRFDAQATRIYQAAFNRAPDAPGQEAVRNALGSGAPADQIAQNFVDSGEFQRAYGSQSNGDFVATLYRNVLHREADAGGKAQFTGALDAGYSRGFALSALADSAENRINTAPATHDAWVFIPG